MMSNPSQLPNEFFSQSFEASHFSFPPLSNPLQYPFPKNPISTINPPQNNNTRSIFFKTRLCKEFNQNRCPKGDRCNFAHGIEELRQPPPNWKEIVEKEFFCNESSEFDHENGRKLFWNSKLCFKFERNRYCPYGDKCQYAHAVTELRNSGGNKELEKSNSDVGPSKPLLQQTPHVSSTVMMLPASMQRKEQEKKFSKWKGMKKISLIYGDWLLDHPSYKQ